MMTILLNLQARQTSVLLEKDWNGKNGFLYFFPKTNNPSDRYFTVCPKSLYLESAGQHNQKISETCFFGLDINFILISNLDSSMYNWKLNTVERRRRMGPFKLCQRNKPKTLCVSAYISIHVLLMPRLFRPWAYIQIYSNAMKGKETLHFPILSKTCFPADIWDLTATWRIFFILIDCFSTLLGPILPSESVR